jgi:hypothetical protein
MTEYTQLLKKYFAETTPQNAKKASAVIGSGENGTVTVNYDIVGTSGNEYTLEVAEGVGVNTAMSAVLTGKDILVTLGTTPTAIASINFGSGDNGRVIISADTAGVAGNDFTITVSDAGANDCEMSAALVGNDITVILGKTVAALEPVKNTATLIAAAITALAGVSAVASGTGVDSIGAAVVQTNFTGGSDGGAISSVKNTATLIATAISTLTDITAVASGTGVDAITAAEAVQDLANGQFGTSAHQPCFIKIDANYYISPEGGDKYKTNTWYLGTPTLV